MPERPDDPIDRLAAGGPPPDVPLLARLLVADPATTRRLYAVADRVRRERMGDEVFLRGLVEFSNVCSRNCDYCGIRRGNADTTRYRMETGEILEGARIAAAAGCTTLVLQSGEDPGFDRERVCALLRAIRSATGLAITLSLGERPPEDFVAFRAAGCDRYLLRFETADRDRFRALHPDDDYDGRLACLEAIRRAGLQVGSGFLIGLPGADPEAIARDILFTTRLALDMIGCGPFIPHPGTPLGDAPLLADREIYFRTLALLRLLNPLAHIPATTAFDALAPDGRDRLLRGGANVFMPNVTPTRYRAHYALYPGKPAVDESPEATLQGVRARLARLGRPVGTGPGHARRPRPTETFNV